MCTALYQLTCLNCSSKLQFCCEENSEVGVECVDAGGVAPLEWARSSSPRPEEGTVGTTGCLPNPPSAAN